VFIIKYKIWREVVIYNLKNIKFFKKNKNIKLRRYIFWSYGNLQEKENLKRFKRRLINEQYHIKTYLI